MRASTLQAELKKLSAGDSSIAVAAARDFTGERKTFNAYRVLRIEPDHSGNELCLIIDFPEPKDAHVENFQTVDEFSEQLAALADQFPDHHVVASVPVTVEVDGVKFERFDMQLVGIATIPRPPLVVLAADGLEQIRTTG